MTKNQGGKKYRTQNKKGRKVNWMDDILPRYCLLEHVVEGKIEGRMGVT